MGQEGARQKAQRGVLGVAAHTQIVITNYEKAKEYATMDCLTKGGSESEDSSNEDLEAQAMQTPVVKKALEMNIQHFMKSTCLNNPI